MSEKANLRNIAVNPMNVLVTAGPTREPLDPVRFLSNRSSGKMGYALAQAAIQRGHNAVLVSGPTSLDAPANARLIRVETAEQMLEAVQASVEWCDVLIMAAAVCDWRPANPSDSKLKKHSMPAILPLESTPDILKSLKEKKEHRVYIGFAAETENVINEARRKLVEKGLDLIVANDVSRPGAGFETDTNIATLVSAPDVVTEFPLLTKKALAERILEWSENAVGTGS